MAVVFRYRAHLRHYCSGWPAVALSVCLGERRLLCLWRVWVEGGASFGLTMDLFVVACGIQSETDEVVWQ